MKGTYILIIELKEGKIIEVGKLGKIFFKKGFYVYIGSAFNGLEQRIDRHLRKNKKIHWHIDYFLNFSEIKSVLFKESKIKQECKIAAILGKQLVSIASFGCSDCTCNSHLFYGSNKKIIHAIKDLKLKSYKLKNKKKKKSFRRT